LDLPAARGLARDAGSVERFGIGRRVRFRRIVGRNLMLIRTSGVALTLRFHRLNRFVIAEEKTMLLPICSLISVETLETGTVIYGLVSEKWRYAIAISMQDRSRTWSRLLYSSDGDLVLANSDQTTVGKGALLVGQGSELFLRIGKPCSHPEQDNFLNSLHVKGEGIMACAKDPSDVHGRPVFIDMKAWSVIRDSEVDATGGFLAASWQLISVDARRTETVIIDVKPRAPSVVPEGPVEPEETFGLYR
jgi:hypothetical protein